MFHYKDGTLFADSRPVMTGIGARAALDGEAPLQLAAAGMEERQGADAWGAYVDYLLHFQEAADPSRVEATITLRCYESAVMGFLDGRIRSENAFVSRPSFASRMSLSLAVGGLGQVDGLLANHQHNDWWTRPYFDPDPGKLPARTMNLLWRDGNDYCRLLPVCGPVFRTDLAGEGAGRGFTIGWSSHQGGMLRNTGLAFVLGRARDPFALADHTSDLALHGLGQPVLPRRSKTFPEVLDYLGWCSWDAFYQKVDEAGVWAKAEEFRQLGLPVRWMMIDDGWSQESGGKLQAFDANPGKFPEGLARTISSLKQRYGIRWVGVWHTIAGYWNGIDPAGPLADLLRDCLYTTTRGDVLPYPDAARGAGFWHAWHGFLSRQGVDFVKVDSQAAINNFLQFDRSIGAAASAAHHALETSVAFHFGLAMINCMGLAPENLWHRPKSAVSRNSDDFMPKLENGFREHALQNAYNSYYHGPLYWGDWDMFWTVHPDAASHAVLRAVSGGPVYVSDPLGRTDASKLLPLAYADGRLLRCDRPAAPTADCLTADPTAAGLPLKLWNTAGGAGVVAAFHLGGGDGEAAAKGDLKGTVSASDVPELAGSRVVLLEHFSRSCRVLEPGEVYSFELSSGECRLFLLVPAPSQGDVTPLGLLNKFVSPHAILNQSSHGGHTIVRVREGGSFGFHSKTEPLLVLADGEAKTAIPLGPHLYAVELGDVEHELLVEIMTRLS